MYRQLGGLLSPIQKVSLTASMLNIEMRRKLLLGTLHFAAAQSAKLLVFVRALDAKVPSFGFEV